MKKYIYDINIKISLACFLIGIFVFVFANDYLLYVATSWLIFGILGLSLDLIWGKAGILSLGQTIFYGLGAYAGSVVGINFYESIGNTFLLVLPMSMLIGALLAWLVGYIIFYGRIGALQTTILTYTLTIIVWTFSISYSTKVGEAVIGGDNGMSNIPQMIMEFGKDAIPLDDRGMFLTVLFIAFFILLFTQILFKTSFGKVIECIRLDAQKTELIGYDIRKYQNILFIISGSIAGLGGGLFALWANYLNPSIFSIAEALLVPIYVLIGGLGSLVGAFLGAIGVGGLSFYLGGVSGGQTTLIIGLILILMVLFFNKGLVGALKDIIEKFKKKQKQKQIALHINIDNYEIMGKKSLINFSTDDVYKSFGGVVPVNKIKKSFVAGKVSCIIGPNGAGKSSYLKVCAGLYKLEKGKIFLNKEDISKWELFKKVQKGIGIKMQKPQIFGEFSIKENIWIAAYSKTKHKTKADEITNKMLMILGDKQQGQRLASALSHGGKQWLDIVMVLSMEPDIILFDEPAAGMSSDERLKLSHLMNKLAKHKIVILVEHDMAFIKTLNADVTVLHQGEVFANGSIDELHEDERILDIYLGRK